MHQSSAERIFLGFGSNLANPEQQVLRAIAKVAEIPEVEIEMVSSLYRSAPMGQPGQADYINAVVALYCQLKPLILLGKLQSLEAEFGRDRSVGRWGPRIIDIDILLFGMREIGLKRLKIPHPGLVHREFVVFPLLEIEPSLSLPDGTALGAIAAGLTKKGLKRLP